MFFNNRHLKPSKKFEVRDLSELEINKTIKNKYRLCSLIKHDKLKNSKNIFMFNGGNNKNISYTYTYYNDEEDEENKNKYKYFIIEIDDA